MLGKAIPNDPVRSLRSTHVDVGNSSNIYTEGSLLCGSSDARDASDLIMSFLGHVSLQRPALRPAGGRTG